MAVSLHWGEEYVDQPSVDEVALARRIIDAGASLVLGHHPHVLRPVERYAHGVIAYSLGNFAGDMIWQPRLRRGAILRCGLEGLAVRELDVTPTRIDGGYIPRIVPGRDDSAIVSQSLRGLDDAAYWAAVGRTVRTQRLAVYRHALLNLWRYRPTMLAQLAGATIRNKLTRIAGYHVRVRER